MRYNFSGGTFYAGNIELSATWLIGSSTNARRITNPGYFKMGGTLELSNAVEHLGQFTLASNSVIHFAGENGKLSFRESSGEPWNVGAILIVTNWHGSSNGGGKDQLKFGHHASALTASQLNRIRFVNPAGFPPGSYMAQTLRTCEVVPAPSPTLAFSARGTNIVLRWMGDFGLQTATNLGGPFEDLSAVSPYTNDLAPSRQRYFRLRY